MGIRNRLADLTHGAVKILTFWGIIVALAVVAAMQTTRSLLRYTWAALTATQ